MTELVSLDLNGIPGTELDGAVYVLILVVIAVVLSAFFWRTRGRLL